MSESMHDDVDVEQLQNEGTRIGTMFSEDAEESPRFRDTLRVYVFGGHLYVVEETADYRMNPSILFHTDSIREVDDFGIGLNVHPTKYHCYMADTIDYNGDNPEIGIEGVTVPGRCEDCGKRVEFYYDKVGVFDPDAQEYIKRV